jgi:hypothetical protein
VKRVAAFDVGGYDTYAWQALSVLASVLLDDSATVVAPS